MTEAIVTDGGKRGQIVKICADPNCRVHHGDKPSAQQLQRERAEERKRIEKQKLAITVRHRILAAVLERVAAPIKKADLLQLLSTSLGTCLTTAFQCWPSGTRSIPRRTAHRRTNYWRSTWRRSTKAASPGCYWRSA